MKRSNRRGAAAVEMAITMVLLIPLIFFVLFLEDFVFYKLEGQEPVVAAAWDHITPDYMRKAPDVGGMNRLKYCDHTAAYDSYEQQFDCNGAGGGATDGDEGDDATGSAAGIGHHHATGAHQCWLGGGQQVRCSVSKGIEIAEFPSKTPFLTSFGTDWNRGGVSTCSAQLNVFNFIIPQNISKEGGWLWSKGAKGQLTSKTQFGKAGGGDNAGSRGWAENSSGQSTYDINAAHKDGKEARNNGDMGSWLLGKEEFGVMVDPWALTDIEEVDPNKGSVAPTQLPPGRFPGQDIYHPLLSRTGNYYNYYAKDAADDATNWRKDMEDKEFLDKTQMFLGSGADTIGDSVKSVPVSWKPEKTRSNNGGYASGWIGTSRQNNFPKSWGPKKAN